MKSVLELLTPPESTFEGRRRTAIDLGSRQLDTGAQTPTRDFVWEEPEESGVLTPDSFEKKTRAEPPTFLRPGLFIGSISAERDLQVLQKYGITHVLQVGVSLRPRHAKSLIYACVKCPDSRNFDVFHAIIESGALQFIEQGRKAGGVLVHCAAGRSRSATVVAAHLMQRERISAEEAIEEIRQKWWICPNIGFRQQLELFHKLGADISRWPDPKSSTWPKKINNSRPVTPQRSRVPPPTPPQTPAQTPQKPQPAAAPRPVPARAPAAAPAPVQAAAPVQLRSPLQTAPAPVQARAPIQAATPASIQPKAPVQAVAPVEVRVSAAVQATAPVKIKAPAQPAAAQAPQSPKSPSSVWMAFADLDGTYAVKPKLELSGFQPITMSAPNSRPASRSPSPAPRPAAEGPPAEDAAAAGRNPAASAAPSRRPAGQRGRVPSPEPGPRHSPDQARHPSPARASVTHRAVSAPRRSRPPVDGQFQSVFVPPSMWKAQEKLDIRAALQSAGLSAETSSSNWARRFSFSDPAQPPKAPVVRAY
ncbi:probable dual specificity protein phosphatase 1 at N-terminal half [Coccomyxa sp. Obi]|nr:probable dual specificity protein phosphatase 1 at N-terminal half [Coccomyxa sp. Obi]